MIEPRPVRPERSNKTGSIEKTLGGYPLVVGGSPEDLAPLRERFFASLADDYNTPAALAALWEWVREANRREAPIGDGDLRSMLDVFALANLLDVPVAKAPEAVVSWANEREEARAAHDYARADELRTQIEAAGWSIRDGAGGFELLPFEP